MATINHRDLEQAELHDPKYHASSHGAAGTDPLTAHSTWVVTDGTHPFTSTVAGITPTADAHLATKGYVDEQIGGIDTFLELNDTPSSYTGAEASGVRVNAEGTALEFYDISPYTDPDTLQIVTDRGATTSNSITTAGLTTAGTVQAEQLTSTDDVTLTGDVIVTSSGVSNIGTVSVSVNDAYIDQVYLKANPTLPLQAATKQYVDNAVAVENLWDRTSTTLTTHNAADTVQFDGKIDWAGGNVIYVPIDGDIATYIDNAADGDTLILAAGEYVLTSALNVTKSLNIIGHGIDQTTVSTNTVSIMVFTIKSSNVRIANLSVTNTGGGNGGISYSWAGNLTGIVLENLKITCSGGGNNFGCIGPNATIRDCEITVSSSSATAIGVATSSGNSGAGETNCYNCKISVTGTSAGYAIRSYNNNSANICVQNMYNCVCIATATAGDDYAAYTTSTTTHNAYINSYGSIFNGADYDIYNSSNKVTLYGTILVNDTTYGTVYNNGRLYTGSLHVGEIEASGILTAPEIYGGSGVADNLEIYSTSHATKGEILFPDQNIIFVHEDANIETETNNADAGDTLILAAGTYDITSDIDISKSINIIGQGIGKTVITCDSTSTDIFNISANDVRISNLSIISTGNTTGNGINVNSGYSGIIIENVSISISAAGICTGICFDRASGSIRNTTIISESSGNSGFGFSATANGTISENYTVNLYNCTSSAYGVTGSYAFNVTSGISSSFGMIVNLYDCVGTATGSASADVAARCYAPADTRSGTMNLYGCTLSGFTYDVLQSGTLMIANLSNTTLVHNTISGTANNNNNLHSGSITSGAITASGVIAPNASGTIAIGSPSLSFSSLYANNIFSYDIKQGANQAAAGALTGELWADSSADYVIKLGV